MAIKKYIMIILLLCCTLSLYAQLSSVAERKIKVKDAGSLQSMLSADEWQSVRSLSVKGQLDRSDFAFLKSTGWLRSIFLNWTMPPWCHALFGWTSLKSVVLPDALTAIANGAFLGCSGLVSIRLPKKVSVIESYAFSGCSNLVSVDVPRSVSRIERGASVDGGNLQVVNIDEKSEFQVGGWGRPMIFNHRIVLCPAGKKAISCLACWCPYYWRRTCGGCMIVSPASYCPTACWQHFVMALSGAAKGIKVGSVYRIPGFLYWAGECFSLVAFHLSIYPRG